MKKLLVILLSLGLIMVFSMTAWAVDVKFGGSYYVVGVYENNLSLGENGYSSAYFFTRTRLQPVFLIAEGLTLTIRADMLEKQWGNTNWKGGTDDQTATRGNSTNVPKRGIQESLEVERAYVNFMTGLGQFQIGYQNVDDWGTKFGDYSYTRPRINYSTKLGPLTLNAIYEKLFENDTAGTTPNHDVDLDNDTYALSGIYKGKGLEAGLLFKYYAYNSNRTATAPHKRQYSQVSPYVMATFGPIYLEGEATYWFGKYAQYELPGTEDVKINAQSLYLKGQYNIGPAYAGALFAYSSGNDLSDPTKYTTAPTGGGAVGWNPALILMNDWLNTWGGGGSSASNPAVVSNKKQNMLIYNAFVGINPTPRLNLEAILTYAMVDKKALSRSAAGVVTQAVSDKLGTEFDVKATYKIYDNLTYMVGAGYLWTGDYFKGADAAAKIGNDYILLNQLTLNF
jgi:hypothetical protein